MRSAWLRTLGCALWFRMQLKLRKSPLPATRGQGVFLSQRRLLLAPGLAVPALIREIWKCAGIGPLMLISRYSGARGARNTSIGAASGAGHGNIGADKDVGRRKDS